LMVLWLSSDLGYSDVKAGFIVAAWSMLLSLFTVLVGSFTDAIGLKKAFLAGFAICIVTGAVTAVTTVKAIALPFGFFPLALGQALMMPVMVAAVRRYSSTAQRSMAFSLYYTLMNVGFAFSGWFVDFIRNKMGEHGSYILRCWA